MNQENTQTRSPENLTRRQKLLRRVGAPLAAVAALGALHHGVSGDKNPEQEVTFAEATTSVNVSTEFGGAESGWGHGTAEYLIDHALTKAVNNVAFDLDSDGNPDLSKEEIETMLSQVPTYDKANELLDRAGYNDALPDKGDILQAKIEVSVDTDKNVTYKIEDAKIKDIPNNQQ